MTGHSLVWALSDRKKWWTSLSLSPPPEIVFWRFKNYLRIMVSQNGVFMEVKMSESNTTGGKHREKVVKFHRS